MNQEPGRKRVHTNLGGRYPGHAMLRAEDPTLQFELNEEAIGLMLKSVSFYLERWPGGPDPSEQEGLIKLKSLFAAALLEYNFNRSGGELT